MAEGTRMESMEENLRKLQSIVQQHSAVIEQWVTSSSSGLEETRRQIGDHSRQMSDLQSRVEENRERMEDLHKKSDEKMENFHKNTEQRLENLSKMMRNLSRDREQELPATGNRVNLEKNSLDSGLNSAHRAAGFQVPTPDRGIPGSSTPNLGHLGNHSKDFHRDFIDRSMSSGGDHSRGMAEGNHGNRILGGRRPEVVQEMELQKDETKSCSCSPVAFSCEQQLAELPPPNQLLSHFGVHLDAEAKSILQGKICEVLPSSEIGIGNVKFLELEILESDGMKCDGLVRDCEKPEFHDFGVSLGSWNLDLHPQVVDGNLGSKAMEFRVMNQPFLNAHEVFEKMSEKGMVDVDDSIGLLSTLRGVFGSIDFTGSIVFDPGKDLQLSSHIETVETIFVFDPGGLDMQQTC